MPVSSTPTLRTIRPLARPMAMPVLRTTQFTKSKHQPRSLLQQVSDQIGGLIPGIGHLATQAGVQLMAPIRAARDVVEGNISPLHGLKVMALGSVPGSVQGSEADIRKYTPLSADMADSMIRTAGNLRHPGLVEKAFGITLRELLLDYGGGSASGRPKATRVCSRSTIISSARSAAPIERMQWWMRPGPSRPCATSKPPTPIAPASRLPVPPSFSDARQPDPFPLFHHAHPPLHRHGNHRPA